MHPLSFSSLHSCTQSPSIPSSPFLPFRPQPAAFSHDNFSPSFTPESPRRKSFDFTPLCQSSTLFSSSRRKRPQTRQDGEKSKIQSSSRSLAILLRIFSGLNFPSFAILPLRVKDNTRYETPASAANHNDKVFGYIHHEELLAVSKGIRKP